MLPPVFTLLTASSAVTDIVGTNPSRIFPNGIVPQAETYPAISWIVVSGQPENMLADRTNVDNLRVQLDCWATSFGVVDALYEAVRSALEGAAYLVAMNDPLGLKTNLGYDPVPKLFRMSADWSFWVGR